MTISFFFGYFLNVCFDIYNKTKYERGWKIIINRNIGFLMVKRNWKICGETKGKT